jgi:GNAT superfamily N-acetyltransferase
MVHIRAIRADDGPRLVTFHSRLSAETVYNRFFAVHPVLSAGEVEHFTHVDGLSRVALVATVDSEIVAVARLERLPDSNDAEVAFVVADDHQAHGIGTELLDRLAVAAVPLGITHLTADTLFSNTPMLRVFRHRRGAQETLAAGVVHVRFPVAA